MAPKMPGRSKNKNKAKNKNSDHIHYTFRVNKTTSGNTYRAALARTPKAIKDIVMDKTLTDVAMMSRLLTMLSGIESKETLKGQVVTLKCAKCHAEVLVCAGNLQQNISAAEAKQFDIVWKKLICLQYAEGRSSLKCGLCDKTAPGVTADDRRRPTEADQGAGDEAVDNPNQPLPKGKTTLTSLTRALKFNPLLKPAEGDGDGDGIPSAEQNDGADLPNKDTEENEDEMLARGQRMSDQQLGLGPSVEPAEGEDDGDGIPNAEEDDSAYFFDQDAEENEDEMLARGQEMLYQKDLEGKLGEEEESEYEG